MKLTSYVWGAITLLSGIALLASGPVYGIAMTTSTTTAMSLIRLAIFQVDPHLLSRLNHGGVQVVGPHNELLAGAFVSSLDDAVPVAVGSGHYREAGIADRVDDRVGQNIHD